MRVSPLAHLALLAGSGVAFAVPPGISGVKKVLNFLSHPAGAHEKFHHKRQAPRPPLFTETVTVTDYDAVVWVDHRGSVISTEHKTLLAASPSSSTLELSPTAVPASIQAEASTVIPPTTSASPAPAPPAPSPVESDPAGPDPVTSSPSDTASVQNKQSGDNHGPPQDPSSGNTNNPAAPKTPLNPSIAAGFGVCYDPMAPSGGCKSSSTISSDFAFLKSQGFAMVRVYDIGCPLGDYVAAASTIGLRLMIGLNTINSLSSDLGKLISMVNGNWGSVDTVYIGNELVNSGAAAAPVVAGAVNVARGVLQGVGFQGNVVTVDTFNRMAADPTICSTSSYCAANAHAYFDPNTAAAGAGTFVRNALNAVQAANPGKLVVITESGWPYGGQCNGQACPSSQNQLTALNAIKSEFAGQPSSMYFFQAYDATYKQPGAFGVEQFFGIFDPSHYGGGF